eukprot:1180571-Prymnesium_polylepis.1
MRCSWPRAAEDAPPLRAGARATRFERGAAHGGVVVAGSCRSPRPIGRSNHYLKRPTCARRL